MTARSAGLVVDLLEQAEVATWVAGGWGVDALVGRASRPHADLDLLIPESTVGRAREALVEAGFVLTHDALPTRFEMTHPVHGVVDLHPIHLGADGRPPRLELPDGSWWVYGDGALDSEGTIGSRRCRCVSANEQLRLHEGYELREIDRTDIELLRRLLADELDDRRP